MSVKQQLIDEILKLKNSEPVFTFRAEQTGWQGPRLALQCKYPAGYNNVDFVTQRANALEFLAKKHFQEHFNSNIKRYETTIDNTVGRIQSELRYYFQSFVSAKFGRDSEIYKWYEHHALADYNMQKVYFEPLLSLYRYIWTNVDEAHHELSDPHLKNAIGILELIHQKYAKPEHVPQPRKRRRRRK